MDKIELRIDAQQADDLIHALQLARNDAISQQHKARYSALRSWILQRRLRRWGDETASAISDAINTDVKRSDN